MRKYLSGTASFFISCFAALFFFCIAALIAANPTIFPADEPIIFFSEDGEVLNLFGETFFISESVVSQIAAYPGKSADFVFSLLPYSIQTPAAYMADNIRTHAAGFLRYIFDGMTELFTVGTSL